MEYERFTKRIGDFVTNHCKPSCPYWNVCEDDDCHCDKAVLEILADLEDKIEQGTLIELGYHIRKSYRNHDDQRYKITIVEENEIDKIGYDGLTREEAEKRLKELQE